MPLEGPQEIVEVAKAYNDLALRLERLLAAERESIADLSHRLRTPMTALRLAVDRLPESAVRDDVVGDLGALEDAIGELIRDARTPRVVENEISDVGAVASDRATFWTILATEQKREFTVSIEEGPSLVATSNREVGAAIDVLIDNVFAHTESGTNFRLTVRRLGGDVLIEVTDDGPGLDRSVAPRGASGAGSTGLGLDIVRQLATAVGGQVTFSDPSPRGTRIVMRLPRLR